MTPSFRDPCWLYQVTLSATGAEGPFEIVFEVAAPDPEAAVRLAIADLVLGGDTPLDAAVEAGAPVRDPLAAPGVRFRSGRSYPAAN